MQSHFVSLEHPYPIICYGKEVAMQVGTLIVVEESPNEDGTYGLETHSHPVVSYMNRKRGKILIPSLSVYPETTVWNKVEANEVAIVCLEDQEFMIWPEFSGFLSSRLEENAVNGEELDIHYANELRKRFVALGIPVEKVVHGLYDIVLRYHEGLHGFEDICYGTSIQMTDREGHVNDNYTIMRGVFSFFVTDGDEDDMYEDLIKEAKMYSGFAESPNLVKFRFRSPNKRYEELVKRLNDYYGVDTPIMEEEK